MNLYTLTRGDIPEATNSDYEEGTALCVMCIYVCWGGCTAERKTGGRAPHLMQLALCNA